MHSAMEEKMMQWNKKDLEYSKDNIKQKQQVQ